MIRPPPRSTRTTHSLPTRRSSELRIRRADRVTYNQRTEVVTATGNVILVEPGGEVVFAEYAELQDGLASGFVDKVSMRLPDNSRLIANSGGRREGSMEVERAIYSPCHLCAETPRRAPIDRNSVV